MKLSLKTGVQIGVAAIVAVVLGIAGARFLAHNARYTETDNAAIEADIAPVASQLNGDVAEILVEDHQKVRKGDVLVRLDPLSLNAAEQAARAEIAQRKADLAAALQRINEQSDNIGAAHAAQRSAEAADAKARTDLARTRSLRQNGWVAQAQLDSMQASADRTEADVAAAKSQVSAAKEAADALRTDIQGLKAKIEAAEADLVQRRIDRAHADIYAPIDGIVGAKTVRPGQKIRAGQQLLVVVPVRETYVLANFKETQLAKMRPGQHVDLKIDAFPKEKVTGAIESFAPAAGSRFALLPPENATGNFTKIVQRVPVRIRIDADPKIAERLAPGLSVTAIVDLKSAPQPKRQVASLP